ncbi:MAG: hypothetical protein ACR2PA_01080, partial [Hyphomicrobiaceae bacterium]
MSLAPRFGVLVLPNMEWTDYLQRVLNVERFGFEIVTTADHFVDWTDTSRLWHEGWSALAGIA